MLQGAPLGAPEAERVLQLAAQGAPAYNPLQQVLAASFSTCTPEVMGVLESQLRALRMADAVANSKEIIFLCFLFCSVFI